MEGDHILQINEWSTEGMRHDDAVRLLRTSNGDLELVVRSTDVTWAGVRINVSFFFMVFFKILCSYGSWLGVTPSPEDAVPPPPPILFQNS